MSALLPLWLICAPAVFLLIDSVTGPKTSAYAGNQADRADEFRSVPPRQSDRVNPPVGSTV